jgi:exocyst complex component 6
MVENHVVASGADEGLTAVPSTLKYGGRQGLAGGMTVRARRRREEAVRKLVADVQSRTRDMRNKLGGDSISTVKRKGATRDDAAVAETHDWVVASTVAMALEKGLDRDLHTELVQEAKDNAGRIGQVCHDHADVFLASVAQVAALEEPSSEVAHMLREAETELHQHTVAPMHEAALQWEHAQEAYSRARTMYVLVQACRMVAIRLERARKQAAAGRPRAALAAVDEARKALTAPVDSLLRRGVAEAGLPPLLGDDAFAGADVDTLILDVPFDEESKHNDLNQSRGVPRKNKSSSFEKQGSDVTTPFSTLEQTPFGQRASLILPKIENEVLMGARRGLNRWLLSLRSGGDCARAGRAVLRQCAQATAVGPGQLSLGGVLPSSYMWRAKTADNLLSRIDQHGKVARAVRVAYWFDRDASKESDRLEAFTKEGMERRAEVFAAAFGWYRCWPADSNLLVDPREVAQEFDVSSRSYSLSGSRHGSLRGSRHGNSSLRGSKHGKGRSLGFRSTTASNTQAFQDLQSKIGATGTGASAGGSGSVAGSIGLGSRDRRGASSSKWNELLAPTLVFDSFNAKEDYAALLGLSESVYPVRRAELAYSLLGRTEEFVQYYEQNRFGETTVAGTTTVSLAEEKNEKRSFVSSLTGDDVTVVTDRIFFSKTLPHLCASVLGFAAVEAALEMGNFADEVEGDDDDDNQDANISAEDEDKRQQSVKDSTKNGNGMTTKGRFRESAERYERALILELGNILRSRSPRATLPELARASSLMAVFRSSLRIVHPSSTTRRQDKEMLALDMDVLMVATRIAQEEQLNITSAIVRDDQKIPLLVAEVPIAMAATSGSTKAHKSSNAAGLPEPEVVGLPFGLAQMKQAPSKAELEFQEQARTSFNRAPVDESFTFSSSVPLVLQAVHARAIVCAAFALTQEELGQKFPEKNGSRAAGYVLDCVEEIINVAAIGMKDSDNVIEEGSVDKAVQVMANISAFQHCIPRLLGVLLRGICHVGLIRGEEIDATVLYAEKILKAADRACDTQVASTYSLVYEICRNKIDSHMNYALENYQWVAKAARDMPNSYCEGLIGYLRSVFASLGPMDEGSRAGLHFSCCGHVAERLVKLLSGKPGDTSTMDDSGLPPITRIDAYGIKNLAVDCDEFEKFAESTGVPQLMDCFNEFRTLTSIMLDKELPFFLQPSNAAARRRKYPLVSLDKVLNILEKYVGTGLSDKLMGGVKGNADVLLLDKKEVTNLIKLIRTQVMN